MMMPWSQSYLAVGGVGVAWQLGGSGEEELQEDNEEAGQEPDFQGSERVTSRGEGPDEKQE